ncbi:MAG TPA: DMT family transporter [Burkholderiales bacterium]|nr:DMT family transporter [Burkholderiales bacterium]
MQKIPQGVAILVLMGIATTFGSNHVAARLAFDHGASVPTAVGVRSGVTALALLALLRLQRVPVAMNRLTLARGLFVGLLVALQSFCLYSAVARIPVALALLCFSSCPMLYVLLSWIAGKDRPPRVALFAVPIALVGLALALNVRFDNLGATWTQLGIGASFAFAAALCFAFVMYFNVHWLKALDGRLRTFMMMGVTSLVVLGAGWAAHDLALPAESKGWLGLALLTVLYGSAITVLFMILPRIEGTASTIGLNFEPIAVLFLAWIFLGQAVKPLQVVGAFLVVGAIAWLGTAKRH